MTALSDARAYLETVSVDSYRYDHPIQLLHRIVAEIDAAPVTAVIEAMGGNGLVIANLPAAMIGQTVRLLEDGGWVNPRR